MGTLSSCQDPLGSISSRSALFAKTKSIIRERKIVFFFLGVGGGGRGIITCNLLLYTMDHPDLSIWVKSFFKMLHVPLVTSL